MRKIKTLKKNYEFKNVLKKGKFYVGKQITIYVKKNHQQENIIGIAISTKACNAVKRNKIKRLISENYQTIKNRLRTGYDIVFLWNRKEVADAATFDTLKIDMEYLFTKAQLLEKIGEKN